jgi:hypothetical protein
MKRLFTIAVLIQALGGALAYGANGCQAFAIETIHAVESTDATLRKGSVLSDITAYEVDPQAKTKSFCVHGGYCYPRYATENGHEVEVLHLSNCKVDESSRNEAYGIVNYALTPIASRMSAADLAYDRLYSQLDKIGLCTACADNATRIYLSNPNSQCGRTIQAALNGNQNAIAMLVNDFPDYCKLR